MKTEQKDPDTGSESFCVFFVKSIGFYSGFAVPQLAQKLPSFSLPHFGQIHFVSAGFAVPQLEQKLPVLTFPHFGHVQESGAGAA